MDSKFLLQKKVFDSMLVGLKKENLLSAAGFLAANITCGLFQSIVLTILSGFWVFLWFISGWLISAISANPQLAFQTAPLISSVIVAGIYGIVWFVFWNVIFKDGIKWFYSRLAFSMIPLVLLLIIFNPAPDPMAMIPMDAEPVFSCIITGIILLPIYSVSIYKLVLLRPIHKVRKMITLWAVMLLLGSFIFTSSWNLMYLIYSR